VSNFVVSGSDSAKGRFDPWSCAPSRQSGGARQRHSARCGDGRAYGFAGTTLDMESFDAALEPQVLSFAKQLTRRDAWHGQARHAGRAASDAMPTYAAQPR